MKIGKRFISTVLVLSMMTGMFSVNIMAANNPVDKNQIVHQGGTTVLEGTEESALVSLSKTIEKTDKENEFLVNLQVKTQHKVIEGGATSDEINVVLVLDHSTSMVSDGSTRLADTKVAAAAFAREFLKEGTANRKLGVVSYGNNFDSIALTDDLDTICKYIDSIEPEGSTNIQGALHEAGRVLGEKKNNGFVVLLTDGVPNISYDIKEEKYPNSMTLPAGIKPVKLHEAGTLFTRENIKTDRKYFSQGFYRYGSEDYALGIDFRATLFNYAKPLTGGSFVPALELMNGIPYVFERAQPKEDGFGLEYVVMTNPAHGTISEAMLLKDEGVTIYGIGMDLDGDTTEHKQFFKEMAQFTLYNSVSWDENGDYSKYYTEYTTGSGEDTAKKLIEAFGGILEDIVVPTEAKVVNDKLSSMIRYNGAVNPDQGDLTLGEHNTLNWHLGAAEVAGNDTDGYTYTTSYRITLENDKITKEAERQKVLISQVGETKLDYTITYPTDYADTQLAGKTVNKAGVLAEKDIPAVKGLTGEFHFTKVTSGDQAEPIKVEPTKGATFTVKNENGNTFTSVYSADGVVRFSNIPSGYTYEMKETIAPEGFMASDETWTVAVAYGQVEKQSSIEGGSTDTYVNRFDPKPEEKVVEKHWFDTSDNYKQKTVHFEVVGILDGTEVHFNTGKGTMTEQNVSDTDAAKWNTTVKVPTIDSETGKPYQYKVVETTVEGYTTTVEGFTIINVSNETVVYTATKEWLDAADQTDIQNRPAVTFRLMQQGNVGEPKEFDSKTLAKGEKTVTFEEAPVFDQAGNRYTYSVVEDGVTGYGPGKVTQEGNGFTVTNPINNSKVTINGTKTWIDNENQYDTRKPVTIELLLNGKVINAVTLDGVKDDKGEIEPWMYTFNTDEQGKELLTYTVVGDNYTRNEYSVQEVDAGTGYKTNVQGYNITNVLTGQVNVTVNKTWVDVAGTGGQTAKMTLKQNGQTVDIAGVQATVEVTDTHTWEGLPRYDEKGVAYAYTVEEALVEGYTNADKKTNTDANGNVTVAIKNVADKLEQDKVKVTGEVFWNNPTGKPDGDVTVKLYRFNEETQAKTEAGKEVNIANGDVTYDFQNLPKYETKTERVLIKDAVPPVYGEDENGQQIVVKEEEAAVYETRETLQEIIYTVEFSGVPANYKSVASGVDLDESENFKYDLVNTIFGTVTITVNKTWVDGANGGANRPNATVELWRTGGENALETKELGTQSTISFTADKYDDKGQYNTYYVKENAPGYSPDIKGKDWKPGEDYVFDITNTLEQAYGTFTVNKTWVDASNSNNTRPAEISVSLLQDGVVVDTITVTGSMDVNSWSAVFKNQGREDGQFPLYNEDRSKAYTYTVDEAAVIGYEKKIDGFTITNTLQTGSTSATVTKHWMMPEGIEGLPNVTFNLLQNGVKYKSYDMQPYEKQYTFNDLPKYDKDQKPYEYTFKEEYDEKIYTSEQNGATFTNRLVDPKDISVTVEKKWDITAADNNVTLPDSIFVQLYSGNDVVGEPVELKPDADGNWQYTFEKLPRYNGINYASYTVRELTWDKKDTIANGGSVTYGSRVFTVTYGEDKDESANFSYTITNSFDNNNSQSYAYRITRVYSRTVDGVLQNPVRVEGTVENGYYVSSWNPQTITLNPEIQELVSHNGKTYAFSGATVTIGGVDSDMEIVKGENTISVDQGNKTYEIVLSYGLSETTPSEPGDEGPTPPTDEEEPPKKPTDEDTDIDDPEVPLGPGVDIVDPDVPLGGLPPKKDDSDDVIIIDPDVPLGNLPNTGTTREKRIQLYAQAVLGLAAVIAAGAALKLKDKKDQ